MQKTVCCTYNSLPLMLYTHSAKHLIILFKRREKINIIRVWKYPALSVLAFLHSGFQKEAQFPEIITCTHKNGIHSPMHGTTCGAPKFMWEGNMNLLPVLLHHRIIESFRLHKNSKIIKIQHQPSTAKSTTKCPLQSYYENCCLTDINIQS